MKFKDIKNKAFFFLFLFSLLVFNLIVYYINPEFLKEVELRTYDWRMSISEKKINADDIVIATIDNKSLDIIGRWPWDRDVFAKLLRMISDGGAKVIAIDVLYTESSKVSKDDELAKALNNGKTVLATAFSFEEEIPLPSEKEEYYKNSSYQLVNESYYNETPVASGVFAPLTKFIKNSRFLGHINMFPDIDGVVRKEFTAIKYGDFYLPSFMVQTYKIFNNLPDDEVILVPGKQLILKDKVIELDLNSGFLIDYFGEEGSFKRVSLGELYNGSVSKDVFKDKIVLVGATALGIYDLRVTPTSQNMPGIEKHAFAIENMINNRFIKKAGNNYTLAMIISIFLIYSIFGINLRVFGSTLLGIIVIMFFSFIAYISFNNFNIWINFVYPAMSALSMFLGTIIYKYGIEEKSGREIKKIFSSYVSDKIVNELIKNPEMAKLGGVRKEITVLFADARGFTTFSEHHTPEEVVQILNELLGAMTDVIMKNDGTLDKFVGDEIMALWNVPLDQKDHAFKAVVCAVEMVRKNRELAEKWKRENKDPLILGIGINSGEAIAGNMGAEGKKMDYTVIGDTVNLGARVEALTRPMNADILITEFTYNKVRDELKNIQGIEIEECEPQKVKGKAEPIRIFKIKVDEVSDH
ncbi:MAG: adenylate/guanylate cyclase domain-containing protein [Proteobacteria bacterium]|nr:adenylate/guanylate cyclase domain-containing protein [Pseudomonadota bacterium]